MICFLLLATFLTALICPYVLNDKNLSNFLYYIVLIPFITLEKYYEKTNLFSPYEHMLWVLLRRVLDMFLLRIKTNIVCVKTNGRLHYTTLWANSADEN